MSNPVSTFFKKLDRGLTAFAKSKAAIPVLLGATAIVIAAGVAVYFTSDRNPINADVTSNSGSASASTDASTSQATTKEDEAYSSTSIDVSVYAGTVLPETEDAGAEYIANTLFLGDSNTYRYMNYGFADLSNAVGVIGMGAGSIQSLDCVKFKTYKDFITIPEALPIMQPQRVVFSYGTNNLGGDLESYIDTYTKAIKACYKAYPYFDIIVNAIPPVDVNRSYPNVTMQQIDAFNEALVKMCEENEWKFLNTSEALKDPDTGFAVREYTVSDGLHLSLDGCTVLFDYIRTHAYETEDTRPTPLKKVPARDETPPDLITEDPLKGTSTGVVSTVDVYFAAGEGGTVTGSVNQTIKKGTTTTSVTAVPNEGYVFTGWSCSYDGLSSTSTESVTYTVPSDISAFGGVVITASFEPQFYQVDFKLTGKVEGATLSKQNETVYYAGGFATSVLTLIDGYSATIISCVPTAVGATAPNTAAVINGNEISVTGVTCSVVVTVEITGEAAATPTPTVSPTPTATPAVTPTPTVAPTTPTPTVAPVTTPAPTEPPVATPAPTEPPVATPAPTEPPVATPAPTEPPVATPAPTEPPVATPAPTQAPVDPPAPTDVVA